MKKKFRFLNFAILNRLRTPLLKNLCTTYVSYLQMNSSKYGALCLLCWCCAYGPASFFHFSINASTQTSVWSPYSLSFRSTYQEEALSKGDQSLIERKSLPSCRNDFWGASSSLTKKPKTRTSDKFSPENE